MLERLAGVAEAYWQQAGAEERAVGKEAAILT